MPQRDKYARCLKQVSIVGLILLVATGAVVIAVRALREPVQDGKTVSYCISQLGEPEPASGNARLALNTLGARTVTPYLARSLVQQESAWRKYYRTHYQQLPAFVRGLLQAPSSLLK